MGSEMCIRDRIIGTSSNRMPSQYRADIIISGYDWNSNTGTVEDLNSSRFLGTLGWERGVISQGKLSCWGAEKTAWFKAYPIEQGATSLTFRPKRTNEFEHTLTGLEVGDEICIGGTDQSYTYSTDEHAPVYQDEYRVVTAINGNNISWTEPLEYPHKQPNTCLLYTSDAADE